MATDNRNLEQLADLLQDGLLLDAKDVRKRTQLGNTLLKLGRHDTAKAAFVRAIKDQPTYAPAHSGLGMLHAALGNWPEAEASLLEAVKLKPDLVDAHVALAEGYAKLSAWAQAAESYAAALSLKPELVALLRGAAEVALKAGRLLREEQQTFFAADMTGDGLLDLVRIRAGDVAYWSNLGYGRFGAKVVMEAPPKLCCSNLFEARLLPHRGPVGGTDGDGGLFPDVDPENEDPETHVPPVHTKTWFHTGAYFAGERVAAQFATEYFQGDTLATLLRPDGRSDPPGGIATPPYGWRAG